MAHIGKLYRRLKRRDLSYRASFGMTYLPERIRLETGPHIPLTGYHLGVAFTNSEPGEVDFDTGKVTYNIPNNPVWSAGVTIRWERLLVPQPRWNTDRVYLVVSGTDAAWVEQVENPFASYDFTATGIWHVNPPFTSSQTHFGFHGTALIWSLE